MVDFYLAHVISVTAVLAVIMETVSEHCEAERLTSSSSTPPPKESSQELTKIKCIRVSVPQPSSRSRSSSDGKIRPIGTGRSRSSSGRGSTTSLGGGEGGIIWTEAELYLTHKMLCYDVQGRVSERGIYSVIS